MQIPAGDGGHLGHTDSSANIISIYGDIWCFWSLESGGVNKQNMKETVSLAVSLIILSVTQNSPKTHYTWRLMENLNPEHTSPFFRKNIIGI